MKAAVICLMVILYAVATPAAAEWTFLVKSIAGDQYFIDFATFKKEARPRAWFMTNYPARTKYGDFSSKVLREADCGEEKIRMLAGRFYTEPMGEGILSASSDQPHEWAYVTPDSIEGEMFRILCRGNR